MKRILIDATSTIESGFNTGIQRVVRNACQYISKYAGEENVEVGILVFDGENFILKNNLDSVLLTYKNTKRLSPLKRYISFKRHLRRVITKNLPAIQNGDVVWTPQEGDVLLLADATWNYQPWARVKEARYKNIKIVHIVYDLLPLKHPELFVPELVSAFKMWWEISNYYVDSYACISKCVAGDVREFIPKYNSRAQVQCFPMGSDIISNNTGAVKNFTSGYSDSQLYLMVGTMEPRKNHTFVLDAFDELWATGKSTARLLIIGRRGWHSELISKRILNHPEFGRLLFWLDDCNDDVLEGCYQISDVLIAASIDEGYGLPIIEAESRGLKVLASDIGVFREVANSSVEFFNLTNTEELVEKLSNSLYCSRPEEVISVEHMTWSNSGKVLYEILVNMGEQKATQE